MYQKILIAVLFVTSVAFLVIMLNQNKNHASQKDEIDSLLNQKESFTAEIDDLQKRNKELSKQLETNNNRASSLEISYVQPEFLKVEWDNVILEANEEKVVIESKPIIEAFQGRFIGITQTENPYPAGFPIGFTFHIFSGDQKYTFYSLENDFFMNTEMDTFYRSEKGFTQLAKAHLSNLIEELEENLFSKLYHSGMIVGEKQFPFPVLESFRIKGIAASFITIEKKEIKAPSIVDEYVEKFTFYYFGDKYYMTLYDKYIHISNEQSTVDSWYAAPQEDIYSILSVLSAG
ncbi:hypothetical protein AB1K89_01975 [Sporosarcina sp. 179-K 8C2 HS]|uniref:hypothetical protein n=1 Tax=Sporosarcina sp. 179-K 8C2 HS TaxID=3142387 RepID=UPI0039A06075